MLNILPGIVGFKGLNVYPNNTRGLRIATSFSWWRDGGGIDTIRGNGVDTPQSDIRTKQCLPHFFWTWALSYYSDLTLLQEFQPTAAQLSMKAALPLAKILATASCRSSKTGPRQEGTNAMKACIVERQTSLITSTFKHAPVLIYTIEGLTSDNAFISNCTQSRRFSMMAQEVTRQ